ncbi:MAG: hypothetical protein M3R49_11070, partial [Chloroflexota bacterium]|nr:hypothetical protein [Chloroflexota bacterium]
MSERSTGDRAGSELPPGWTSSDASTPGGFVYVNVWREFPDMTQFELDCALAAPLGSPPSLAGLAVARVKPSLAGYGVATVRTLREARGERLDLSEDHWGRLLGRIWPHLTAEQRLNANEILAELDLTHPKPPRRGRPPADLANSAPARRKPRPKL